MNLDLPAGIQDIITTISEGDRTSVYLAADQNGDPLIYKVIRGDDRSGLYERIARSDSVFFPKIIECFYKDGETHVTEEFIEGRELDKVLEEGISLEEGLSMAGKLMEAVKVMHSMDPPLLHRDIKPSNILIMADGTLKLIDFEAAREYKSAEREHDTTLLGTRGFAAPEQFGYNQTDERSDVYSVGIVCNLIMDSVKASERAKKPFRRVYSKATMFDPKERFDSAESLIKAFNRARRWKRRLAVGLSICAIAAVSVILVAVRFSGIMGPSRISISRSETTGIVFKDSSFSYFAINRVTLSRYSPNGKSLLDRFDLSSISDYTSYDGIFSLPESFLKDLTPGNYILKITLWSGEVIEYRLDVHE